MGKKTNEIVAFKCKAPRLRHDISGLMGFALTITAFVASFERMAHIVLWKQYLIVMITYIAYVLIVRAVFNTLSLLSNPTKVIISKEGAYIRGHMKQIEIIKHSGYTIIDGTLNKGMSCVEGAIAVNLKLKNVKKTVFIENVDGKVIEKLESLV